MTGELSPELAAWLRLTPEQRAEAERRFRILTPKIDPTHPGYRPDISQRQLAEAAGEDEPSISRWLGQWLKGLPGPDGKLLAPPRCKAALAPRLPGPPPGSRQLTDEERQEILDLGALFVRRSGNPDRLPVTAVHKALCAKRELEGGRLVGLAQVRAELHAVPYQDRLGWSGGIEHLKKKGGLPRMVVPEPDAPNVIWLWDQWIDHGYSLDPDLGELIRLVYLTIIDAYGGGPILKLVGHRRLTAFTTSEALIAAIAKHGKPALIRCDFGKENKGPVLSGCEALGIRIQLCTPRDPSVKGLIEGVHAGYDRIARTLPHYAPPTIKDKPLCDEPPLTVAQRIERFEAYAYGEYNNAPYRGQHARGSQSRWAIRQAAAFTPITASEDELRVLFAQQKLVTVHSQGIKRHGIYYFHPALARLIGQQVLARQGREDLSILVHDRENRFICEARNALAESAGFTDEARREFTSHRRALAKSIATQADERVARARSKPDWLLLRARQQMAAQAAAPARRTVRQLTRVSGETPQAQAAGGGRRLKLFRTSE